MERPIPYKGDQGYIFVSYAHKDAGRVWPIIARLQQDGFRVWYDEGIDPGTEWDENIAAHVSECGCFVAVLTEHYLASDNCKDELKFSRDLNKPQVLIYLEDVELPPGMVLRIGRKPSLRRSHMDSDESLFAALYPIKSIAAFRGESTTPAPKHKTARRPSPLPLLPLLIAAAVLAWMVVGYSTPPPKETTEYRVLADTEQMTITLLGSTWDEEGFSLRVSVVNKTSAEVTLSDGGLYLNGAQCNAGNLIRIAPSETVINRFHWSAAVMEQYGISPADVTIVEGNLWAEDLEFFFTYYPYGQEKARYVDYSPKNGETVLMDTAEFLIASDGMEVQNNTVHWNLYLQNHTTQTVTAAIYTTGADGKDSSARLVDVDGSRLKYVSILVEGMDNTPQTMTVEFRTADETVIAAATIPYEQIET